ncbi:MAG: NADH-quinone oxidoreductase subunit N [Spirochaetes bacterium]|nr:MAG: NADH-quinone oxidoreductase subunit N [Spirochaetota bacterium]
MDYSPYLAQIKHLAPEITLLAFGAAALLAHLFARGSGHRLSGMVALAGLGTAALVLAFTPLSGGEIYSGTLNVDPFSMYLKMIFLIAAAITVTLSFRFFEVEGFETGEIYYLVLFSVIGMMFTVSAVDLITFYISFETFAIISYILAGIFKKELRSSEAGIKYFILGILSSAIMLLGMAILFGITGETGFARIAGALADADATVAMAGMVLVMTGLFFKIALVPFHMWTPDVYEGTPTPLVVLLSTAPKAAALAVLIRLVTTVFARFETQWVAIFTAIAIATMFWGNIAALVQDNVKRMMGFSSIAHAGYLMIGLAAAGSAGTTALLFYLLAYFFMNATAFALILLVQKGQGFGERVDDLRGLARHAPLSAACIVVALLSLAGIPPTAGFIGKYYLLLAAMEKEMYALVAAGAINTVISIFYYFRIGRALFMESGQGELPMKGTGGVTLVICGSALFLLLAGIFPSRLTEYVWALIK